MTDPIEEPEEPLFHVETKVRTSFVIPGYVELVGGVTSVGRDGKLWPTAIVETSNLDSLAYELGVLVENITKVIDAIREGRAA